MDAGHSPAGGSPVTPLQAAAAYEGGTRFQPRSELVCLFLPVSSPGSIVSPACLQLVLMRNVRTGLHSALGTVLIVAETNPVLNERNGQNKDYKLAQGLRQLVAEPRGESSWPGAQFSAFPLGCDICYAVQRMQ